MIKCDIFKPVLYRAASLSTGIGTVLMYMSYWTVTNDIKMIFYFFQKLTINIALQNLNDNPPFFPEKLYNIKVNEVVLTLTSPDLCFSLNQNTFWLEFYT